MRKFNTNQLSKSKSTKKKSLGEENQIIKNKEQSIINKYQYRN